VGLGAGTLRYQYRLHGSSGDWSPPGADRSLRFASLAPGAYGFEVRAVAGDGKPTSEPASARFVLLAPVWRRWWFGALAATAVAAAAYAWHRRRLARVVELERIRTRIATDLHDALAPACRKSRS
jgi:signal transduction histidine kinase